MLITSLSLRESWDKFGHKTHMTILRPSKDLTQSELVSLIERYSESEEGRDLITLIHTTASGALVNIRLLNNETITDADFRIIKALTELHNS